VSTWSTSQIGSVRYSIEECSDDLQRYKLVPKAQAKAATPSVAVESRSELIEQLAAPIKYARAQKLMAQIASLVPFTGEELQRIVEIGEHTERWEPPRIAFYRDLSAALPRMPASNLAKRLSSVLKQARRDLVSRLSKSSNYPTARMYIDALRVFDDFTVGEVERVIAVMVENKRIVGMRLEERQFLFYRDLLAKYASQITAPRLEQLVVLLKTAVEGDAALSQLKES
jgi:hypothetical protein